MEENLRLIIEIILGAFSIFTFFWGRHIGKLDRYRDRDRKLYKNFLNLLPKENMTFYHVHDFGGLIPNVIFENLRHFQEECEYPQNYFLTKDLEKLKEQLLLSSKLLQDRLRELTIPVENRDSPFHVLPHGQEISKEEHFSLSVELDELAEKFYKDYSKFVIAAEKNLA